MITSAPRLAAMYMACSPVSAVPRPAVPRRRRRPPHQTPTPSRTRPGVLHDAVDVIGEGQQIAAEGIRYMVDGIIPAYGMFGMFVAKAKVGKTTFGQRSQRPSPRARRFSTGPPH